MSLFSRRERHVGKVKKGTIVSTSGQEGKFAPGSGYEFLTGIVKEYISDTEAWLDQPLKKKGIPTGEKLRDIFIPKDTTKENLKRGKRYVSNPEEAELMTRNSIIAYIIDDSLSSKKQSPFICYPFFPSHLSLPLKPGEHVWLIKEGTYGSDKYYWMCRKPGFKQTEDVNYTYAERIQQIDAEIEAQREKIKIISPDELRDFADFENAIPSNLPDSISNDKLVFESFAYRKEFTGEPVPSVKQKCGDALLQGSNNTMLHLTTEKFQLSGINSKTDFTGKLVGLIPNERQPMSPAIDLCVGRKRKELESLKKSILPTASSGDIDIIKNQRGESFTNIENYEINKVSELQVGGKLKPEEGVDHDATNCAARLYLSGDCSIDDVFGSTFDVMTSLGGTAVATFADVNRVVADTSLRLANRGAKSFLDMDPIGNVVMKSSIADGQQFLSLSSLGTTRLQARAFPLGKIELAVRNDNGSPTEPYILYSELRPLLADMCADIASLNLLSAAIGEISTAIEAIAPPWGAAVSLADSALTLAGATTMFAGDAKITADTFPLLIAPTAGRLGSGNSVAESGTIASKKIFGE